MLVVDTLVQAVKGLVGRSPVRSVASADGYVAVGPADSERAGSLLGGPVAGVDHGRDHVDDHLVVTGHLAVRGDRERRDDRAVGSCDGELRRFGAAATQG
jgi:hypothetical protein